MRLCSVPLAQPPLWRSGRPQLRKLNPGLTCYSVGNTWAKPLEMLPQPPIVKAKQKTAVVCGRSLGRDDSWRSAAAAKFETWCRNFSWTMCEQCHRLQKRPLHEVDISGTRPRKNCVAKCLHCASGTGYPTVAPEQIPEALQHLPPNVLWALRPLEPDVGRPVWARHGYRVHTDMIRFWWRPQTVRQQIQQLVAPEEQARAQDVYYYLMASHESSYGRFVEMHEKFLRRNRAALTGSANDRLLQLPRRALEEEGLECAVWPHLYPLTAMCETYVRKADVRRQERAARQRPGSALLADATDGPSSSETEADDARLAAGNEAGEEDSDAEVAAPLDFARAGRNSAKSAYLAKVLGPTLGYGSTYEVFQFVYDLWLWSALGAKRNAMEAPLRLAMGGYSFAPEYWHTRHAALVDLVRQLGLPTLFLTVAPYEWSFPFHHWVEDEATKLLRSRLHLPVAETLRIAHVLTQTVVGFLTGANKQIGRKTEQAWKSHVFAAKDGSGKKTVVNFFGRLEYQDGKRRRYIGEEEVAAQFYHGRGTVHLHLLVWLQHVEAICLESAVAATVPEDNEVVASLVNGSQRSWTGSGWPRHDGSSFYDAEKGLLRLRHTAEDWCTRNSSGTAEGVRAYLVDLLTSLHCHVDVQMSDGRGLLLKYVSGYVPKFSDSFTTDWLNDACSDYCVAKRVLCDYHPLEPEMALQLAMQWFPQCFSKATLQRFRVPVPWIHACPERVAQYMASEWRADDMPLSDFLRKTNGQGHIHQWVRKLHRAERQGEEDGDPLPDSVEAFANAVSPAGDVAVAAMYLSRYNDQYYGQWALMHVPSRAVDDLLRDGLDKVPAHLYYQTLVYLLRPAHWTSEEAIRAELELEAFREHHIRNIVAMLFANQGLIREYLNGTLDKNQDACLDGAKAAGGSVGREIELSRQQKSIYTEIVENVQAGMQQRLAREDAWKGGPETLDADDPMDGVAAHPHWQTTAPQPHVFEPAAPLRPALAVLGPAGSGKSTAVHKAIRDAAAFGGRVLLAAPTGRLAATMREKFPDLEVDTVHGAFLLYKPVQETLEILWPYDLIVVEEVGQLSRASFERIVQQWQACEKIPTLVFVGDFYQLPGVDPTCALDSPYWHNVTLKKKELHTMLRCKCPKLRKTLEILRTGKPTVPQLRAIKSGHKAPSLQRAGYIMNEVPTADDVAHILAETPTTLFLTVSRGATALLNQLAVAALFGDDSVPLAVVPADPESNVENYVGGKMVAEEPLQVPIYKDARVILTKNLNKAVGFVNGMGATVLGMQHGNVVVRTDQGILLAIHPWTSESRVVHFPLRLGYSSTLHKVQGATLSHVTLWLDVANMPAAAYVALSRVEYDANWRFVGNPGIHHFTPARFH